MPPDPIPQLDFWLASLGGLILVASLLTLAHALRRRLAGRPLLAFQPRTPVPWGAAGAGLALLLVLMATTSAVFGDPDDAAHEVSSQDYARRMMGASLQLLLITALVTGAIAFTSGATHDDLGLPRFVDEFLDDLRVGGLAWLAAILPVYGVQALLVRIFQQPSQHPLITTLLEEPSPMLLAVGVVSAVVVAPICEELAFRLLLQGWLEKLADRRSAPDSLPADLAPDTPATDVPTTRIAATPPTTGWPAIVVSALLFALAHLGHGPDPVALFLLALVLGYIYRRTHRILPCIVAHALFNALSLLALGLVIWSQ